MEWWEVIYILALSIGTPLICHKIHWGTWFDDPFSCPYDTRSFDEWKADQSKISS